MIKLFKYMSKLKKQLVLAAVLYVAVTLSSLFMPYVMSSIVNKGVAEKDMDYIIKMSIVMLGIAIAGLVCNILVARVDAYVSNEYSATLAKVVFEKINGLSFEDFGRIGAGSLITRATDDVTMFAEMSGRFIYIIAIFPVMFFGGVIMSLSCDKVLALVLLLSAPFILLVVRLVSSKMGFLWEQSDKYIDIQNKIVRERLSGVRVIRAFDREAYEHERVSVATRIMAKFIIKANVLSSTIHPVSVLLLNIATVVMLYVAADRMTPQGLLTAGDVVAVIQYVTLIMNGIITLSWTFISIPQLKVRGKRIVEVLELSGISIGEDTGERFDGNIEFDHVTFQYEGSQIPVLEDINMSIKAGECVGIIGGTGSGKSSIVKLLLHFYEATKGSVKIDGHDYRDLSRETTRGNMSVALQKGVIFGTTVKENVRMGEASATDEEILKALDVAQMTEFLESHSEGFDYVLAPSGTNISGGQKQRIGIARAIVKKASIYIFDDSFSALDFLTESKLRKALNVMLKGKTQIVVTQRAATAMRCDKVFCIDKGRLVGSGTHAELMKNCAVYREIYDSQLGNHTEEVISE